MYVPVCSRYCVRNKTVFGAPHALTLSRKRPDILSVGVKIGQMFSKFSFNKFVSIKRLKGICNDRQDCIQIEKESDPTHHCLFGYPSFILCVQPEFQCLGYY